MKKPFLFIFIAAFIICSTFSHDVRACTENLPDANKIAKEDLQKFVEPALIEKDQKIISINIKNPTANLTWSPGNYMCSDGLVAKATFEVLASLKDLPFLECYGYVEISKVKTLIPHQNKYEVNIIQQVTCPQF